MKLNKLKDSKFTRELSLTVNEESDNVELAFASDYPVERGGFTEILDVKGMDLSRLNSRAQLLFNHNQDDYIGVVEGARLDEDGIARASVKFGSSARAKEIEADVRSGILSLVSFGYFIRDYRMDGEDSVVVTDFEPFEISIVTTPADPTVGVGRSMSEDDVKPSEKPIETTKKERTMDKQENVAVVDNSKEILAAERTRTAEIQAIGDKFGLKDEARSFIEQGKSLDEFRDLALGKMEGVKAVTGQEDANIGLTEKEARNFSLAKAVRALADPKNRQAQEDAAFEFEASRAAAEKMGKEARGIMLPMDVMTRAMSVGTATAGGNTVDTNLMSGSLIDLLQNKSYMLQMANVMTGLQADIAIPRQTGGATAYWVAEDAALTTSQASFDLVNLTPKSLGGTTYATRKLLLQSDLMIDSFIQRELARVLALEIDRVAINGSGAGAQPTGILNTTGIGSVPIGANGGAITRDAVIDLETAISSANADLGNLRYITNAAVRGAMRKTAIDAGSGEFLFEGSELMGYETLFTNQVPSNLDKGTSVGICSAMLFGNFADLLVGLWSGIDIVVDPYSFAKQGGLEITAFQDIDMAVRHAESFAAITDITTA